MTTVSCEVLTQVFYQDHNVLAPYGIWRQTMKLYHCISHKDPITGFGNFGDELNLWLWQRLIPGILDGESSTCFVGIGTILNDRIQERCPEARTIVVFGSGVGYGGLPKVDDHWKIYCLRGPLSAEAIGVSEKLAVTDPAVLVRRLFSSENANKACQFAFMPHEASAKSAWEAICKKIGFGYIDPCWSIESILSAISQTGILIAEAMHGAIVADALRVPWIPVYSSPRILQFKWRDWCSSIGVNYEPKQLLSFWLLQENASLTARARNWAKEKAVIAQLLRIAKTSRPSLSKDADLEQLTVELEERLEWLKQDVAAGAYS